MKDTGKEYYLKEAQNALKQIMKGPNKNNGWQYRCENSGIKKWLGHFLEVRSLRITHAESLAISITLITFKGFSFVSYEVPNM